MLRMTTSKKASAAQRVRRARDKLRAQGMRPVQIWVPDVHAPGFAAEAARQCRALAEWEATPEGREEMAWLDALNRETFAELDELEAEAAARKKAAGA
jgi:hypothetical protein